MALSIRNKDTEAAVRRLAARTGLGLTEAIHEAVNRRLADLDGKDLPADIVERRRERMDRAIAKFREGTHPETWLTDDDLYDELGLPK